MNFELEHLSYSSISTYLGCGAYWKFKYADKIPLPTATELIFGSAFHGTIEQMVDDPQRDIQNTWRENWKTQLTKNADIKWNEHTPESLENDGLRMFGDEGIRKGIANIKPKRDEQGKALIETKVELRAPGVPLPVVGYIDVIAADGVPGDFKTSKSLWSNDKANSEVQPLFYLAAMNQMGIPTPEWKFRHFVFVKTKQPQFQQIEHAHNPAQLMWLFRLIGNAWKGIEAGIFPENPTGWRCSPGYCEFWSICRGKG